MPTNSDTLEDVLLKYVKVIGDGEWSLLGTPDDLLTALTEREERIKREAKIEELNRVDNRLYDISSTEWGIPTKWSDARYKGEKYADLWSPNEAIHEVIKDRISELTKDEMEQEN